MTQREGRPLSSGTAPEETLTDAPRTHRHSTEWGYLRLADAYRDQPPVSYNDLVGLLAVAYYQGVETGREESTRPPRQVRDEP